MADAIRILVVSDDPLVTDEVSFAFPANVSVDIVTDAREAIAAQRDRTPSAVIVDLQTGTAGGYALAKQMAATERLSNVPVLILLERSQDEWLARQAGAVQWRVKPIDSSELVDATLALVG